MEVQKLQRYDLVERIAAGGMGEVFRARATGPHGFEKTLAVKRVLPELASDEAFVERFVRESKLAVSLSHANIVQVFDLGRSGDDLFLVMEYVHGTDLLRLLLAARAAGRSIPLAIALLIVAEAAQGLAYAHGRYDLEGHSNHGGTGHVGVIHCDISPSNLLVSYSGEVKLTDFGVAQLVDHTRRTPAQAQHVMGKWRYMAPEQIRGEAVDARTDLYALGVVLYELLTGRRAYGGDGVKTTCDQVLAGSPPRVRTYRPDVPEELDRLLARVMSVDPRDRPADARTFLNQISQIQRTLDERVTSLDLGSLVRDLVPPPNEGQRRRGLTALLQPMVLEPTQDRAGSVVHRRKPAASFLARMDGSTSQAITQWIPASDPLGHGTPGGIIMALWDRRVRWRIGATLVAMTVFMGVGLATGLKMRQLPMGLAEGDTDPLAEQRSTARPARLADAQGGAIRFLPQPLPPQPLVERLPRGLSSLLLSPSRGAASPADPARSAERGGTTPQHKKVYGYLDIYVEPWAHVVIDGKHLEQPTPLRNLQVHAGNHHLVLSNPILHKQQELDVMVNEGQTQKVEAYLVEK